MDEGDEWDGCGGNPFLDLAPSIMGILAPRGVLNLSNFRTFSGVDF